MTTETLKTLEERKAVLVTEITHSVRSGAHVEYQADTSAVMVKGRRVNHVLHLLISVFTLGLWLPVWGYIALRGGPKRQTITVDEFGATSRSWWRR